MDTDTGATPEPLSEGYRGRKIKEGYLGLSATFLAGNGGVTRYIKPVNLCTDCSTGNVPHFVERIIEIAMDEARAKPARIGLEPTFFVLH